MGITFTLRAPQENDLENIVHLLNNCEEAEVGHRPYTIEDIRSEWTSPNFNPDNSIRLVELEDKTIVGYGAIWDNVNPPVAPYFEFQIHPKHTNTFAGKILLDWGQERAQECINRVAPDLRVALSVSAANQNVPVAQLFKTVGFVETLHFWQMKINLDQPLQTAIWPDGLQPQNFQTKEDLERHLEEIVAATDESFEDHYGHIKQPLAEKVKEWQHEIDAYPKRFDPTLWFYVKDKDDIAAVCLCLKEDFQSPENGRVHMLGVRRPWRKKGLGFALLLHAFHEFQRRGKTAVTLGVDANSLTNATKLYKKAGMHIDIQYDTYEKIIRAGKTVHKQA